MMPIEVCPADAGSGPIAPKEAALLLPSLSTRAQLDEIERLRINAARVWAMRGAVLRRGDLLTEAFVRDLHRRMFGGIWRGAGRYRTNEGGKGWEARRIPGGVRMFLDDAEGWIRFSTYPVHEAAVRLHHRLRSIQPWSNGNGRHARLLADIVVASQGEEPLTWGSRSDPAGSPRAGARYLDAIRAADSGGMERLVDFARS
ncbi:MAG TPA: mobile mystery protein B [Opitutaceae bacterium]|nr:mobile mystery protein B [Opitutaceae bacterium]